MSEILLLPHLFFPPRRCSYVAHEIISGSVAHWIPWPLGHSLSVLRAQPMFRSWYTFVFLSTISWHFELSGRPDGYWKCYFSPYGIYWLCHSKPLISQKCLFFHLNYVMRNWKEYTGVIMQTLLSGANSLLCSKARSIRMLIFSSGLPVKLCRKKFS